jgi:hypothetical protein
MRAADGDQRDVGGRAQRQQPRDVCRDARRVESQVPEARQRHLKIVRDKEFREVVAR